MQTVGIVLRNNPLTPGHQIGLELTENYHAFTSKCPSCLLKHTESRGFENCFKDFTSHPDRFRRNVSKSSLNCTCGNNDKIKVLFCSYDMECNPVRQHPAFYRVLVIYSLSEIGYAAPEFEVEHNYLVNLTVNDFSDSKKLHQRLGRYLPFVRMDAYEFRDKRLETQGCQMFLDTYKLRAKAVELEQRAEIYNELVSEFAFRHSLKVPSELICLDHAFGYDHASEELSECAYDIDDEDGWDEDEGY